MVEGVGDASALTCPDWVQFWDAAAGVPYFVNVKTGETANEDPEPEVAAEAEEDEGEGERWWMCRPARTQAEETRGKTEYVEGHENFNVWSGRFDRERGREPPLGKCFPETDSGWTQADLPGASYSYHCVYFAQGVCNRGSGCPYFHHVPTEQDENVWDQVRDVFGRERFAVHRDDMRGVGSIEDINRTLFVGDIRFDRAAQDPVGELEEMMQRDFAKWGKLEQVRAIPRHGIAFVRYKLRACAEFAKLAMANQRTGYSEMLDLRWARPDPNPRVVKQLRVDNAVTVEQAVDKWTARHNLSDAEKTELLLSRMGPQIKGAVAPYPDVRGPKAFSVESLAERAVPARPGKRKSGQ